MTFQKDVWNKADYEELKCFLNDNSDEEYRAFHSKLCKTSKREIIGVRLPILRGAAKDICRGNAVSFLECCENSTYEETMLEGMVISGMKMPLEKKLPFIKSFLPKIDNWAVCDSFCSGLKPKPNELEMLYSFCEGYIHSNKEYEIRFATVMMMDRFITEEYIERVFDCLSVTDCSYYYTSMAVAWSLSVCFAKFRDKTMDYLERCSIDNLTFNRAIQKITESYRVAKDDKLIIKDMKRK